MLGKLKSFFGELSFQPRPDVNILSNAQKVMYQTNLWTTRDLNTVRSRSGDSYGWVAHAYRSGYHLTGKFWSDQSQVKSFVTQMANYKAYQEQESKKASEQELALKSKLSELQTSSELAIQQANIERAKWQSEKEKLEQAILVAKMKQEEVKARAAEEQEMDAALKKAQMHDAEEKAKKRKKTVRNLAVGAAAIAALTQVI